MKIVEKGLYPILQLIVCYIENSKFFWILSRIHNPHYRYLTNIPLILLTDNVLSQHSHNSRVIWKIYPRNWGCLCHCNRNYQYRHLGKIAINILYFCHLNSIVFSTFTILAKARKSIWLMTNISIVIEVKIWKHFHNTLF